MRHGILACASLAFVGLALAADPPKKDQAPAAPKAVPEADRGEGVSLTIYNQDFVVVKDRRRMDLAAGRSTVRFRDVAATIVPETVQFTALKRPSAARVAEQNYEFDLVSADKLLHKYIDRPIAVVNRDGETVRGTLLSFDDNSLVLRTDDGVSVVPRGKNVKDVQFSALPGGLLTKPTLVWQVDAKEGGQELVKVAYRADKMNWRVDYRARVTEDSKAMDLSGWVTVTNQTGTAFKDAQVKLMAGDVHIVQPNAPMPVPMMAGRRGMELQKKAAAPQFAEKSFAEYHLYELGRTTTLKDRETKQIELLDVESIPVQRKYAYNGSANPTQVAVVLEFKNDDKVAQGLGVPLPKGPVRVFQKDADGELEFAGTDDLDHTPKKELVKVRLGYAFDLSGERKQTGYRQAGNSSEQDIEVRVRNHKAEAVTIDVVEPINGFSNWSVLRQNRPYHQRDVSTLVFPVEVKPNTEEVVTYTIRYTW